MSHLQYLFCCYYLVFINEVPGLGNTNHVPYTADRTLLTIPSLTVKFHLVFAWPAAP